MIPKEAKQMIDAVIHGDVSTISHMLSTGCNINLVNTFKENLFFIACENGQVNAALYLLDYGANPLQLSRSGRSSLNAACYGGSVKLVEKLLLLSEQPAYSSLKETFDINFGFFPKNFLIFSYLIQNGFLNEQHIYHLDLVRYRGHPLLLDVCTLILSQFPELELDTVESLFVKLFSSGSDACLSAIGMILNQYPNMIMQLGSHFEDLLLAVHKLDNENEEDIVLEHNDRFNEEHLLFIAPPATQHPVLSFLLQHGFTKNHRDKNGDTLLHFASTYTHNEYEEVFCIRCLLDIGYDVNIRNAMEKTPLHTAIEKGMLAHAIYLIYRGADVNATDLSGLTALDYANNFCVLGFTLDDEENIELREILIQVLKTSGAQYNINQHVIEHIEINDNVEYIHSSTAPIIVEKRVEPCGDLYFYMRHYCMSFIKEHGLTERFYAFGEKEAERISKTFGSQLFLNICPLCSAIKKTPRARLCLKCGEFTPPIEN